MTQHFLNLWIEARTRFSNQLEKISEEDLKKTLGDSPNSVGFLMRHIAEVELLFAKNVFKLDDVRITAKTVIDGKDTGKWTDLSDLKEINQEAFDQLKKAIEAQTNEAWEKEITTKEFGTKTLAEAFGRVVTHTAYHAGQMALAKKYGTIKE
ncbi:DinB family protein [Psychroflexus sp. CAK57W]|uniref:DinB family protein n=1 Tax=Psychroflexus curvus TaxID=2873595 RepID=UPI001CCD465D|nr:DinB family protein [Psychroflexus curvus]MBZ9627737.1 DinB family protein [Psychroflexus curvus]MBZ9786225.1 DinB family protein [Psychroflexus curvus]